MKSKLRSLFLLALFFSANTSLGKEKSQDTPCIDDNKFYRNPNAPAHNVWSPAECAKYYLCLDNEVFEFRCSQGLLFDVSRQVCDFKANVDNCDVMSESQPPRPLLEDGDCGKKHLACGDGTCFPATYFCDGSVDCPDGSDEGWCDIQDDPNGALPCNPERCQLPNCWCSKDGTQIPGNLTTSMVPQMITITFDDAVNAENFEIFSKIFSNDRKNPNGCPIRGTFYVSHQYTNYRDVQYLWNVGHEIAAHSVTHRGPEDWWSRNATIEDWFDEMVGVANIINKYAAVRLEDIKGLRTPFLRVGWNRQFLMMSEFGFVYDSSMLAPFSNVPVWPYTLDYRPPHNCVGLEQLCPTRAYPGVWELPINQLLAGQYTCARMDSCPSDLSGEDVYKILMLNFKKHYLSNRAPLGLHFHASWFQNPSYFYAFSKFIDDVLRLNDVYFITTYQMENQGFEEEHQQPRSEETPISSREFRHDSHTFSFDTSGNELSPDDPVSNADGHVYEDILPGVENPSKHSGVMIGQDQAIRRPLNAIEYVCKSPTTRSLDREEIAGTFRRNLTLPFRRGTGLDSSLGSCSIRGTNGKRIDGRREDTEVATWNADIVAFTDDAFSSRAQSITLQSECRPSKKRRKKDCKHCRSKAAASSNDQHHQVADKESGTILRKNRNNEQQQRLQISGSNDSQTILDPRNFTMLPVCCPNRKPDEFAMPATNSPSVFTISEKVGGSPASTMKLIRNERSGCANLVDLAEINEDNALIGSGKNRPGMRVNSIYSQDRWYAKGASMLFTDAKEHGSFQRAYSLPVRTQTPSSQNRINLRRSVRGEPPPHPARLRKHRHGWTLHLAHPLEASGCTRPLVLLLIALLLLLGIGAVALYIAFEPEKLQIIQQYLKSSTNDSSSNDDVLAAGTFLRRSNSEQEQNDASAVSSTTPMQPSATSTLAASILLNSSSSFPESRAPLASEAETEATSPSSLNSTRYCDDCLPEEVCVALVDEEAPTCRIPLDPKDPTGCAGFCLINKQKCHRLDVDAFRCVEMEHYCLDDEWTCLNTLCIPLEKHCDGHMNCYDHSDEHNCNCDLETHFQCGNETSCLPLEKRCDGKIDCWDAADEINCTLGLNLGGSCPSENEFTCSNGQCILRARFCDSLPDCLDGSDEPHGCQGRCNKHEFTCQNNRCITKGMKCNGIDDCGDGTDERHCKDRFS